MSDETTESKQSEEIEEHFATEEVKQPEFTPVPPSDEGGGFPKWLIYIGILVVVNILSQAFDWGFWIY